MDIIRYWKVTLEQNPILMKEFFHKDALIRWHNTNEQFNLEEFIMVNCEYPGKWTGSIEKIEYLNNTLITACKISSKDNSQHFHVCSFFTLKNDKIISIDEYWGDDGPPPKWRLDKNIGNLIK